MEIERIPTEIDVIVRKKVTKTTVSLDPQDVESAISCWLNTHHPTYLAEGPVKIEFDPKITGYGDWEYEGHSVTIYVEDP